MTAAKATRIIFAITTADERTYHEPLYLPELEVLSEGEAREAIHDVLGGLVRLATQRMIRDRTGEESTRQERRR